MLCNDRELMQHLSSYIEVLKVKSLPEPSIYLPIKIANHILKIQPHITIHASAPPYVPFFMCRIPKFLHRRLFSWEWPLKAEGLSKATER